MILVMVGGLMMVDGVQHKKTALVREGKRMRDGEKKGG